MLNGLWQDIRFACRLLAKDRAFTLVVVTALGLGIGVANMQFVLVNAFCLRGLPIADVHRVLFLAGRANEGRNLSLSYREFEAIRSEARAFGSLAAFANASVVIGDDDLAPDRAVGTYVSAETFRVLAERPAVGRDFEPADDRPGAPRVAILGDGIWNARYAADRSIIGRPVRINGTPTVIIGVMAAGFRFPSNTEVWQPLAAMPGIATTEGQAARSLSVIGRMTAAATISGVVSELGAVGDELARDYPETNRGTRVTAVPINERYNARITDPTWVAFIGVGGIVLLIACANAANLLLMRSIRRGHEMAVRASLGASRRRLVQQLLAESAVLAVLGGMVGTALSLLGVQIITGVIPENTLAYYTRFIIDGRVFAVLCGVCLATVFVFGLAPALHVSRANVSHLMRDGGRGGTSGVKGRRWTTAFLTAEFALTMVVLNALALGVRVARGAERAATVVDPTNLTTTSLTLSDERYRSTDRRVEFYRQLDERLAATPGIASGAVTTSLPLSGAAARRLIVDGLSALPSDSALPVWTVTVSPRYFEVMGLQLLQGRAFAERDGSAGNESAIVNQRMATMLFPLGDAVGRRVRLTDPASTDSQPAWLTIVGIAPNIRQRTNAASGSSNLAVFDPDPIVYLPIRSAPPVSPAIVVRGASDAVAMAPLLRETVRAIDPELPLYRIISVKQAILDAQWNARISTMLLNTIALVAVLLAAVGLYAVAAHVVVQRTREIGVRMALGARRQHVVWIVVRRSAVQLALGLVAGVGATLAFEGLVRAGAGSVGFRMSDPLTVAAAAAMLTVVTALASVAPAYGASRLDPVRALRYD